MTTPSPTDSAHEKATAMDGLIQQRREKKNRLLAEGKGPYGKRFERTHVLSDVHKEFESQLPIKEGEEPLEQSTSDVRVAGRLLTRRDLGKLCFAHLQDHSGRLQLKLNLKNIGDARYKEFLKEVDLGDILGVLGRLCRTKTGELTLDVQSFEILSKSLRPWPEKYHGLTDVEVRTRQRELDLTTNESSRQRFFARSAIIRRLRQTLDEKGFVEVETPMMQTIPGGAMAKPFMTHHAALDMDLYMRIAPELYLKRLLVGGYDRVYEIGRAFRNEGIDTRHNPEFTILEAYQAYGDVNDMMDLTEKLIHDAARALGLETSVYRGETTSLLEPFDRASLIDLFKKHAGLDLIDLCKEQSWRQAATQKGISVPSQASERKCFDLIFDERILPHLNRPTFVLDFPAVFSPLAKKRAEHPYLADRFELFVAKEEVANAYTEQNDPDEQRRTFNEELAKRQAGDEEAMFIDENFITALEYGMPPAGGLGIGIDRLTMILTGAESIREVILFPLLKPQ